MKMGILILWLILFNWFLIPIALYGVEFNIVSYDARYAYQIFASIYIGIFLNCILDYMFDLNDTDRACSISDEEEQSS